MFRALGYEPYTYDQVFQDCFNMTVAEFAETSSRGPLSMQDRYVTEDIPMGATLTVSLARSKRAFEKREKIRKRDIDREISRALRKKS